MTWRSGPAGRIHPARLAPENSLGIGAAAYLDIDEKHAALEKSRPRAKPLAVLKPPMTLMLRLTQDNGPPPAEVSINSPLF